MRQSGSEKVETIRLVEDSELSVTATVRELGLPRSTFYGCYRRYKERGAAGLLDRHSSPGFCWNRIPGPVRKQVVETALTHPDASSRKLAWKITDTQDYFISESSVYRILKGCDLITSPAYIVMSASDRFQHPTRRTNELWQTGFTYFRVVGWGWYYLSTVLDDYSRYIIAWKLFQTMAASDVQEALDLALEATGVSQVQVRHRPRLLSDNGPCDLSHKLKHYLRLQGLEHTRGAPYHPMTQGKIERYHRSMKNVVKLENYYYPWELKQAIAQFVEHYNHHRYHESLNNVTPADIFFGRHQDILSRRERIKQRTLDQRRIMNLRTGVVYRENRLLAKRHSCPKCSDDVQGGQMNILKIAKIPAPAIESQCTVMDGIRMMEKENVGGVLVLQGGQLIGTFGERDVMLRVALSQKDPQTTLIGEVMTAPAVTIDKSTTVGAALEIMREHHFRHLPIVSEDGKVEGMVSMRYLLRERTEDLTQELDSLASYLSADGIGG